MRLFVSILALVLPAAAAVVTGTVRDPEGRPVAGATVRIEGGLETRTGQDGAYRLDMDGAGAHKLTAECDGFLAVQQTIAGAADQSIDLRFTQLAPSVQSVIVHEDVRAGSILSPDPGQRVMIRDEMLDANPGRPGVPVSIPGLPAETASGGIKAPQYFAPGVAGDHGEPIA